jgi:hypothetical protein
LQGEGAGKKPYIIMHSVKDDGWAVVVDDEEAKEEVGEREREREGETERPPSFLPTRPPCSPC